MDGNLTAPAPSQALAPDEAFRQRLDIEAPPTRRPRTMRWLVIMAVLLAIVLGALYGFNRFREHAIASFFASNKPPPAQISAVTATLTTVPDMAPGIGALQAVQQVTITPEVGGRVVKILFQPGAEVTAGEPLVQLDDGPDRGDLANYQAQAQLAGITLQRSEALVKRQFTPQETVDQNRSQLAQANALIQKTQAIIAQKLIRAPFAGRLGVRQIDLGQYLTPGAPIVTLTDLSTLYANFTLPSQVLSEIKVGQVVDVTVDAYHGRVFKAKITTIEPQISADTRTLSVQASLANPDNALRPGMFINASVALPPEPNRVTLPETAVDYTLYGDSVYLIRQDGTDAKGQAILKAHRVSVKTGKRWGNNVEILNGLNAGDRVVAAGQVKVQDGAQVAITGAPPQPPAHPTLN